jgi:hypothetical protein
MGLDWEPHNKGRGQEKHKRGLALEPEQRTKGQVLAACILEKQVAVVEVLEGE